MRRIPISLLVDQSRWERELNNFLKKHNITNFDYKFEQAKRPTPHHLGDLILNNQESIDVYEQFNKYLVTEKIMLIPAFISLEPNVNEGLLLSKFKDFVQKKINESQSTSTLITNGKVIGIVEANHSILIDNFEVHELYKAFQNSPDIAFMLKPKIIVVPSIPNVDKLFYDFGDYLNDKYPNIRLDDRGFTTFNFLKCLDGQANVTIHNKELYQAFKEFYFPWSKSKIEEQLSEHLNQLKTQLNEITPDNSSAKTAYEALKEAQSKFFEKLIPTLTAEEFQKHINEFKETCFKLADDADKVMGPGWLARVAEVVIRAVLGLFAGIGMVLEMAIGQGFLNEAAREGYKNTFFKPSIPKTTAAFTQFKETVKTDLEKLTRVDDEPDDVSLKLDN